MKGKIMEKKYMRLSFIVFFFILAILFILLTLPFLKAGFLALTLAVIFAPFYRFIQDKLNHHNYLSSLLTTVVIAVCVIIPLAFLGSMVVIKAGTFLKNTAMQLESGTISGTFQPVFETLHEYLAKFTGSAPLAKDIEMSVLKLLKGFSNKLFHYSPQVVSTAVTLIANFLFMFLFLVVFLAEGDRLYSWMMRTAPLSKRHLQELSRNIRVAITSTLGATLVTGVVQGALLGVGFWVAGFEHPYGWWLVATIISVIPIIGAASCYLTATAVLYSTGNVLGAILFLLFGLGIVSSVDNIIRSFLIRGTFKIHPLLLFVSLLGALNLMGPIGIVVGPVLVVLFLAALKIYQREFAGGNKSF